MPDSRQTTPHATDHGIAVTLKECRYCGGLRGVACDPACPNGGMAA